MGGLTLTLNKQELDDLIVLVTNTTLKFLEDKKMLVSANEKTEKTAYQKTEQLLYNYMGFKKIIREREQEIDDLRKYGVPQTCGGVKEYVQKGGLPHGIVLEEESVEAAVANVRQSVAATVQAIALIDKCMSALKSDPYYKVLEMRYFEGRTQEDIAMAFNCNQATIARNKSRLIKELSMRLFPNQTIDEMLK